MTLFQIVASFLAFVSTMYYLPGVIRKEYSIQFMGYVVWALCLILCAVSWLGVK